MGISNPLGFFVLGGAGASPRLPALTEWRSADSSLAVSGSIAPRSISLTEPPVDSHAARRRPPCTVRSAVRIRAIILDPAARDSTADRLPDR
jgi:hypothetical protein